MSPLFEGMFFSDGKNDQSANGTGSLYEETVITAALHAEQTAGIAFTQRSTFQVLAP